MPGRAQRLSADDVRAQVQAILRGDALRGKAKLGRRLQTLVEMVVLKRHPREFGWQQLEHQLFEDDIRPRTKGGDDSARAQNRVRQELFRIKQALEDYYAAEGEGDRVLIEIVEGTRRPRITDRGPGGPVDDRRLAHARARRLIVRAKLWLDARTWRGDIKAIDCANEALTVAGAERTAAVGFAVIWLAVMPRLPALIAARWSLWEKADILVTARRSGYRSWEVYYIEACVKAARERDWGAALALMRKAAELSTGEVVGYWWYPALLASQDALDEAIEMMDGLVGHYNRTNVGLRADLAILQAMAGAFQDAQDTLLDVADAIGPGDAVLATHLALVYEAQDRCTEALACLKPALERFVAAMAHRPAETRHEADVHHLLFGVWGLVLGRVGDAGAAHSVWESSLAQQDGQDTLCSAVQVALAALGVGRHEEAVVWMRRAAFDEHDPLTMWFHIFPPFRHLRGRADYAQLLRDVGLGPKV